MLEESSGDDGTSRPADEWESCESVDCVASTQCVGVGGLDEYEPFCAPQCESDDDCPFVPGGVLAWCALIPDGELDPDACVLVCSLDGEVQGVCPAGMDCVDVPDAVTPISVCMWS